MVKLENVKKSTIRYLTCTVNMILKDLGKEQNIQNHLVQDYNSIRKSNRNMNVIFFHKFGTKPFKQFNFFTFIQKIIFHNT